MVLKYKRFSELANIELYKILKLRVDVFVVEQKCPYKEIDDLDQDAIHVWYEEDGQIQAYLRVMDRGVENEHVSIGRVIAVKRRCGIGSRILTDGIEIAEKVFAADKIYLEAQVYAKGLYEKNGFKQVSEPYDIDGIPHIKMIRS
ncbi:GCN5-related N-acetyltransferase [Anaerovibrio sp. JC8]|uniref:GNAT family N-acetyltransferase n=1 Tax=Anaerovibrio sp. JC8 TaxID=1240085 RepID=UPI000A0B7D78|nr:GNAT family N-acetyltransferase [Anaerovibrio sp. JC8]ORT99943.1 GCN5-related N-acetyltransferase [Anaerovibrio sp. JC8]